MAVRLRRPILVNGHVMGAIAKWVVLFWAQISNFCSVGDIEHNIWAQNKNFVWRMNVKNEEIWEITWRKIKSKKCEKYFLLRFFLEIVKNLP